MDWIALSLLAAFLWAVSIIIDKFMLERWVKNPLIPLNVILVLNLGIAIPMFALMRIQPLSFMNLALIGVCGLLNAGIMAFYFKAMSVGEASRISPLYNLSPLFIMVFAAIFLGEVFTPVKYAGILLIVAGSIFISFQKRLGSGVATAYALISVVLLAAFEIIIKYLLGFADYWSIFAYTRLATFIFLVPFCVASYKDLLSVIRKHRHRAVGAIFLSESITMIATLFSIKATSLGPVTLVNALTGLEPFFVLAAMIFLSLFMPHILKEEMSKGIVTQKIVACVLMLVGAILVS